MTLQEWVDRYPGDPEALIDALVEETERLRAALADIMAANDDFRKSLPEDWEGDLLQDACERARPLLGVPAITSPMGSDASE